MKVDADVLVIGAGPAGLTAAYCISKDNPSVIVIEKDPVYVGGISRTVSHNGYLFDIGGHRFFSKSKEVVDLWDEILPQDFIERPRLSRIYYGGKYYSYPLDAFQALSNLGIIESALCMLSFLTARMRPIKTPTTFHQWVRNQFGERLFSIFFKTYTEKVWGMSCDMISADWAAQRIKGLNLGVAVAHALRKAVLPNRKQGQSDKKVVKTLIESFQYPRKGPGMMWEAAAQKVTERGGKVLMARELKELHFMESEGIWRVVVDAQNRCETYFAKHVISSAPLRELIACMPCLGPETAKNAEQLRYRDFITVALMIGQPDLFPDNWIYIHDPAVKVGRVQNFRSWSPEMVKPGTTCLGLEYFCFEGDGMWNSSDDDLITLAKMELEKIGIASSETVIDACVVRQQKAYPVYDETYRTHVTVVRGELEDRFPTLHVIGRNGMHKYNNQDHAMMTAMLTARNIALGRREYDVWQVNEDAEYHEEGASGHAGALSSERLVPRRIVADPISKY